SATRPKACFDATRLSTRRCSATPPRSSQRLGKVGWWSSSRCRRRTCKYWWAGTGLNRRHQDFQSCALPTELPAHQTREDSRRERGRLLPERRSGLEAPLFDGRDDAEGARL